MRTCKAILCFNLLAVFVCLGSITSAAEKHPNGWFSPAVNDSPSSYEWPSYPGHVGYDYMQESGSPVYAISHGEIVMYDSRLSYYGSACGGKGGAVLVRHVAKGQDGYERTFYAVYGHNYIREDLNVGDIVEVNEVLGYTHAYFGDSNADNNCTDNWPHLHFGIRPDEIEENKPYRGNNCFSSDYCGWESPKTFLDENHPGSSEVSCIALQKKYPEVFMQEDINECIDAYFYPPNEYSVWHRVQNGLLGYWGVVVTSFNIEVNDIRPRVLGASTTIPDDPDDDEPSYGGPDGNVKHVEVSDDGDHWHSSFIAHPKQKLQARINYNNKGDETIDYIEAKLYRSPDKDFDPDHDHSYGREEEEDDLSPGDDRSKHRDFEAPETPGTYYLFAYLNRVDGEYGGEDQNWDNNVSRNDDREEYVPLRVEIPEPWASFSVSPTLGMSPLTVQFTDTSRWGPTSWLWDFGDGQTSTAQHPSHVYTMGGYYTVALTVSNEKGETKTAKVGCVKVDVPPSFRILNPTSTDNWRSSDVKDIKWEYRNFPSRGTVRIEYSLNDGASWRLIDANADNDGIRHWDMCKSYTTNTKKARIRITSNLYPSAQKVSDRFEIDHARGCK